MNFLGKNSKTQQSEQVMGLKLIILDIFIIQVQPRQQQPQGYNQYRR